MNIFKRAMINIIRQWGKSVVLILLIFTLGTALLSVLSMSRGLIATEEHLLMRVPAVATLVYESTDMRQGSWQQPTREDISTIGSLPYVRNYDFTFRPSFVIEDLISPYLWNRGRDAFFGFGRGVNNPDITDIASGSIILIEGRTFTQEEIDNDAPVVVIPRHFSQTNELSIGSMIELENIVYNPLGDLEETNILGQQTIEVKVIGIVARYVDDYLGDPYHFYMPIGLAEKMLNFVTETQRAFGEEEMRALGQGEFLEEPIIETLFLLYSPRDLETFTNAAAELLPDNWVVVGIDESVFGSIVSAMDMVLEMANTIWWAAISISIVILTLVIRLFLHDRRHEIGIYMALGEKGRRVVIQILTEVVILTGIAIVLTLFTGDVLTNLISSHMLERHLIEQVEGYGSVAWREVPWELELYIPGEMTVEEIMELYDVTLDGTIVLTFITVSIGVIFISTLIPIRYALKLEPKELLS